jgi:hypothetical protein
MERMFRKFFGVLLEVGGMIIAVWGVIRAIVTIPYCGPWLSGDDYLACRADTDSWGLPIAILGVVLMASGYILFKVRKKCRHCDNYNVCKEEPICSVCGQLW